MNKKYSGLMKPKTSIDEESVTLIKKIFQQNEIKEKIDSISEINSIDFTGYIKYKTTFDYQIYWTYKSDYIIILIRNNGIFKVKLK